MAIDPSKQIKAKDVRDIMKSSYLSETDPFDDSINGVLASKRWSQINGAGQIIAEKVRNLSNTGWLDVPLGDIPEGDKGDITVSNSAGWLIKAGIVSTSKLGGDVTTLGKNLLKIADAPAGKTLLDLNFVPNVDARDRSLHFGTQPLSSINGLTASRLIGRYNAGFGIAQEIALSSDFSIAGGVLTFVGNPGASSASVKNLATDFGNSLSNLLTYAAANATQIDVTIDTVSTNSGVINFTNYKNIRFVFVGAGKLIHSGGRLTIPQMLDPGNRKVFSLGSGGQICFAQGAVTRYALAWYADTQYTDCTEAIDCLIASLANNSGGTIFIPNGVWCTRGGHILSYGMKLRGEANLSQSVTYGSVLQMLTDNAVMFNLTVGAYNYDLKQLQFSLAGRINCEVFYVSGYEGQSIYHFNAEKCCFTGYGTYVKLTAAANQNDTLIYVTDVTRTIPANVTLDFGNGVYATLVNTVNPGASTITVYALNGAIPINQTAIYQGEVTVRLTSNAAVGAAGLSVRPLTGTIPAYTPLFFLGVSAVTTAQVNAGDSYIPIRNDYANAPIKVDNVAHYGGNIAVKVNGLSDMEFIQNTFKHCQFYGLQAGLASNTRNFGFRAETCHFNLPPGGTGFDLYTCGSLHIDDCVVVTNFVDRIRSNASLVRFAGEFNLITIKRIQEENLNYLVRNSIYPQLGGMIDIENNGIQSNIHTQGSMQVSSRNNRYFINTAATGGIPYTDCAVNHGVRLRSEGDKIYNYDPAQPSAEILLKSTTRYSMLLGERGMTYRPGTAVSTEYCCTERGITWVQPGQNNVTVNHTAAVAGQLFRAEVVYTDDAITQRVIKTAIVTSNPSFNIVLDSNAPSGKPVKILWTWISPVGYVASDYANVTPN